MDAHREVRRRSLTVVGCDESGWWRKCEGLGKIFTLDCEFSVVQGK